MGTFKRIKRAIKAEINYGSDNSEKVGSRNTKELERTIVRLRQSIIQATSAKKRVREKYDYSLSEAARWQERAWLAMYANDDYLAREALLRKRYFEKNAAELEIQIKLDRSTATIANLQQKLTALEMKVAELKMLETKQYSSEVHRLLQTRESIMSEIDTGNSNAMSAFERMEDKVMSLEVESEIATELSDIGREEQFPDPWILTNSSNEIAAMKAQLSETSINRRETTNTDLPSLTTLIDAELDELRTQLND